MKAVPQSLIDYRDTVKALAELEELRDALESKPKEMNLGREIMFLNEQISDLNSKLDKLEKETRKILKTLQKQNSRAHTYAWLSYRCGYKWEEIADICNAESPDAARAHVFQAMKRLQKAGLI